MPSKTIISRERLTSYSQKLSDHKILYVQAPAGYGKTVFAAQWLEGQHGPGAVITLDEYDNTVDGICHKLRILLETLCPKNAQKQLYSFTKHRDFDKAPAEFLMRGAATLPYMEAAGVVIDDLHYLTDIHAQKILQAFLIRLPANASICILSRNQLPDLFSSQVLKQQIGFLPKEMLLFDSGDIRALYQVRGIEISENQARRIRELTEGWPLGISALLLSEKQLPAKDFSTKLLGNFLKTQVWNMWEEETREFMVATCMEDPLTESLCDALTGRPGSGRILDQMLADGVFLSMQADHTYRFHRIFREFLQKQFLERPVQYQSRQFSRAGIWYRDQDDFYQAVRRFSLSRDYEQIARCFDMLEDMNRAEFDLEQVMRAVHDTLDEEIAEQYPFLYYMKAFTARNEGKTEAFKTYADLYYSNYPRIIARNPELAHNIFFLYAMDFRYSLQHIAKMAAKVPTPEIFKGVRGSATLYLPYYHRSYRDFSELLPGDIDEKTEAIGRILGTLLGEERDMILLCIRGGLHYEKGDLQQAYELALSAASCLQKSFAPESKFCALILLMTVSCALGQPEQGKQAQEDIRGMIESEKTYYLQRNFDAVTYKIRIGAGETKAAQDWMERDPAGVCEDITFFDLYCKFTTARACIALGNLNQAVILLEKIWKLAKTMKRPLDLIEAEILLSIAFHNMKRGGQKTAMLHLEQAVLLAQPYGYIQAFANDSEGIAAMMTSLKNRVIRCDYDGELSETFVKKLYLAVSEQIRSRQLSAPETKNQLTLTPRQKRVARLMCEGYSYRKIAEEMGIRYSTVRSHIELIYRKLDVSSMDEAIRKIHKMHLLEDER